MWYVIYSKDKQDSLQQRLAVRPDHLARLQELAGQNRLLLAGPRPAVDSDEPGSHGFQGSLVVAKFESLEEAERWAQDDPFVAAGVYETVEVSKFKQVFP
jgi:uncharacterized protein YciI